MGRGWIHGARMAAGAAKGKLFTKIAKEITVAVKLGGPNADGNARLRAALKDAQKSSMPKDTVDRAIKRGTGVGAEGDLEEIVYEGFGPHKVPCVVEVVTDNRNRAAQDIRAIFSRLGAGLGSSGSVMWMFDHLGHVLAKAPQSTVDPEEAAINAGANDVEKNDEDESFSFFCDLAALHEVTQSFEPQTWEILKSELMYRPKNSVELNEEQENEVRDFLNKLDDHDDVKRVHLGL